MAKADLHQGNCIEVLKSFPDNSFDAIVSDPPFAFAGSASNGRASQVDSQFFAYWWRDVARELSRVLKLEGEGFLWCDWRSAHIFDEGFFQPQVYTWRVASMLYHYREMVGMGRPFRSTVDMVAYLRGPKSEGNRIPNTTENWISKYWYYGKHEHHEAEKSVEVAKQLIEWCSDEGMTILDPFMGSGTVGVACIPMNRNYVGIELDPDYFSTAEKRVSTIVKSWGGVLTQRAPDVGYAPAQPALFASENVSTHQALSQPTRRR